MTLSAVVAQVAVGCSAIDWSAIPLFQASKRVYSPKNEGLLAPELRTALARKLQVVLMPRPSLDRRNTGG